VSEKLPSDTGHGSTSDPTLRHLGAVLAGPSDGLRPRGGAGDRRRGDRARGGPAGVSRV